MGLKKYKPTSPGRRFQTVSDFADITRSEPEKSLVEPLKKKGGRKKLVKAGGKITSFSMRPARAMVLEGKRPAPGGNGVVQHRISWTPNEDGSVKQLWEASQDGGESWNVIFDGLYMRNDTP